jgi:hypothetical protein
MLLGASVNLNFDAVVLADCQSDLCAGPALSKFRRPRSDEGKWKSQKTRHRDNVCFN